MNAIDFEKYYPNLSEILLEISDLNDNNNLSDYFGFDISKSNDLEKWMSYFTQLKDQIDEILSYETFPRDLIDNLLKNPERVNTKEYLKVLSQTLNNYISEISLYTPDKKPLFYKKEVRCCRIDLGIRGFIYISVPHSDYGYDLISCQKCGEIYCCSREDQAYNSPISDQIKNKKCCKCDSNLDKNYFTYPDKFINSLGKQDNFNVDNVPYLSEIDTLLKKFYSIR